MNKKNRKILKGFTLVEMVVSVGLFAVMSTVIAGIFSSGFSSYKGSREVQRDVESVQFAINTMAKHLRTSSVVSSPSATDITFYDYSSGRCFRYVFQNGELDAQWRDATDPTDSKASLIKCDSVFLGGRQLNRLTSGYAEGQFFVVASSAVSGSEQVGRIAVSVKVKESSTSSHVSQVQTTVSLRDYDNAGY